MVQRDRFNIDWEATVGAAFEKAGLKSTRELFEYCDLQFDVLHRSSNAGEVLLNAASEKDVIVPEGSVVQVDASWFDKWVTVSRINGLQPIDTGLSMELRHTFHIDRVRDYPCTVQYRFRVSVRRRALTSMAKQWALGDVLFQPSIILENGLPK